MGFFRLGVTGGELLEVRRDFGAALFGKFGPNDAFHQADAEPSDAGNTHPGEARGDVVLCGAVRGADAVGQDDGAFQKEGRVRAVRGPVAAPVIQEGFELAGHAKRVHGRGENQKVGGLDRFPNRQHRSGMRAEKFAFE